MTANAKNDAAAEKAAAEAAEKEAAAKAAAEKEASEKAAAEEAERKAAEAEAANEAADEDPDLKPNKDGFIPGQILSFEQTQMINRKQAEKAAKAKK